MIHLGEESVCHARIRLANGGACGGSPYGYDSCGVGDPLLNATGTRLIFPATATNLVAGDTNGRPDVLFSDLPLMDLSGQRPDGAILTR